MIGTIHTKDALFLTMCIGEAKGNGDTYELLTGMSGSPLVRSKKTGKQWTVGWDELIDLAVKAGVSKK